MEKEGWINQIHLGDSLNLLKQMPDEFVDCIITSPPYYALRDYNVEGQIGQEESLDEYFKRLLDVTAELKRVLKQEGTLFWNHGDSYGGSGDKGNYKDPKYPEGRNGQSVSKTKGISEKCLLMQNYRLVMKMCDEQGWILRNNLVWYKRNSLPTSVKDRWANKYEPIFFFTKNRKYYFDLDSIRKARLDAIDGTKKVGFSDKSSFNYRVREAIKGTLQQKFGERYSASEEEKIHYNEKYNQLNDKAYQRKVLGIEHDAANIHPLGGNPGNVFIEKVNESNSFSIQTFTIVLRVEEFKYFFNFLTRIIFKLEDFRTVMMRGDFGFSNLESISQQERYFSQQLKISRQIKPNIFIVMGEPYTTISINYSPNKITIIFGRYRWVLSSIGFSNSDPQFNKPFSHIFAINTKGVSAPFIFCMDWVFGLPLPFDILDNLSVLRAKTDSISSPFNNTTITKEQAQDICLMRTEISKKFFIDFSFSLLFRDINNISHIYKIEEEIFKGFYSGDIGQIEEEPSDFLDITNQPHKFAHFACFPERLVEPLIKAGCPLNGVVLDPFAGSCTTCLVALKTNRKFIGLELNKSYIEIGMKRLKPYLEQIKLQ